MIKKTYQIKIYWIDGAYKATINPKQIMNDLTFSANINWWQWQMTVSLNIPFSDTTYWLTDVVKVTCFDEDNIAWRLIYTWYITQLDRIYSSWVERIDLKCLWLYSLLNTAFYYSAWFDFIKNQAPDATIKDVIDNFNTLYTAWRFSYTAWNISAYWSNINIAFDYTKSNIAIANIQKATNDFFFYIDQNGDVTYKSDTFVALDHKFTVWKDVQSINVDESVENVVNKLILKRGSTATVAWPYEDATSQSEYGLHENIVNASDIQDVSSANIYWNTYIDKNKDSKSEIVLTINSNYDLESIRPWQFVSVYNTDLEMKQLQIQKTQYKSDQVVVYLDKYETFADTVLSNK